MYEHLIQFSNLVVKRISDRNIKKKVIMYM